MEPEAAGGGGSEGARGEGGAGGAATRRERLEFAPEAAALPPSLLLSGGARGGAEAPAARPAIGAVGASPLLARLQAFLPEMERKNAELEAAIAAAPGGAAEFDIENLGSPVAHVAPVAGERGAPAGGASGSSSDDDSDSEGELPAHVAMDLQAGVLELRTREALEAAEKAIAAGGGAVVDRDRSDASDSSDSDASDAEGGGSGGDKRQSKRNPGIVELS